MQYGVGNMKNIPFKTSLILKRHKHDWLFMGSNKIDKRQSSMNMINVVAIKLKFLVRPKRHAIQ